MRRSLRIEFLLCALAIAFGITTARAEWISNGTPAGHNLAVVTTDGSGGAFIGSIGGGNLSTLQHVTKSGDYSRGWPSSGIAPRVRGGHGYPADEDTRVAADGTGGVYVSMQVNEDCQFSCAGDQREIRVIRLLGTGEKAAGWPAGGISLDWVHRLGIPTLVSNGDRGVLICWWDSNSWLRIQTLDPLGRKQWADEGIALVGTRGTKGLPTVIPDGSGGAFVFWMEGSEEVRLVGQHVSSAGKLLWAERRSISTAAYEVPVEDHWYSYWNAPAATADGSGGAIVAWSGKRSSSTTGLDVYATRVTHGGATPWGGDLVVSAALNDQSTPRLVAGRGGQTLIAWRDRRDPDYESFFVQSLNPSGREKWASGGIPFCSASGTRDGLAATEDGDGGAYFAWHDSRPEGMVYATRLTPDGRVAPHWPDNGAVVCERLPDATQSENRQWAIAYNLGLVADGEGTAILAWSDSRTLCGYDDDRCNYRSFAMRLDRDGPTVVPSLAVANDVPLSDASTQPDAQLAASLELAVIGSRALPSGGCEVRLSLATSEPARLDVFDLAGRRQLSKDLGAPGPGAHSTTIRSTELSRGVFFVRLTQGTRRTNARIVLTR